MTTIPFLRFANAFIISEMRDANEFDFLSAATAYDHNFDYLAEMTINDSRDNLIDNFSFLYAEFLDFDADIDAFTDELFAFIDDSRLHRMLSDAYSALHALLLSR